MTDNELIKGIRENNEAVWREIYRSNYAKISYKIAPMLIRAKGKTFDDVYSDALVQLMENVKDGKLVEGENTNLSGYIYTLCWRIALRLEDRGKREDEKNEELLEEKKREGESVTDGDEKENDGTVSPEEYMEAMAFLERVLSSIPEHCRALFRRFYWDKMSMKEIAALMGLKNDDSAKTTKSRCMKKFKDIAKALLDDDTKAEEAVKRTVERSALRDLLEDLRLEEEGELSLAAMKDKKDNKEKD